MERNINELVRVGAIFLPGGKINPVWFDWHRRKHKVSEVTYRYTGHLGEARLLHFTVTAEDGGQASGLYELTYNTSDQSWRLSGIEEK
jgi:hypothetical protein